MFESAEIGHRISKARYKREEPKLRTELLEAQFGLLEQNKRALLILVSGVEGAGKGETVNLLNEWMDPRHIRTEAFELPGPADLERPYMYRFWQALPQRGRIGIFFGSWYTDPILRRVNSRLKRSDFAAHLQLIRRFEQMLAAEDVMVLKLWFHLSQSEQKKRLKKLSENKLTAWRVRDEDWKRLQQYERYRSVSADALRETATAAAPWHIIEGTDEQYRALTAGKLVLEALQSPVQAPPATTGGVAALPGVALDGRDLLGELDHGLQLAPARYERELERAQGRLNQLSRDKRMRKHSLVLVFEGMDAAGKGSTIRRVTRALDARFYRVVPVAAPSDEERAQPYLWRFWRHLPAHGKAVIFDRSWYGRVLVERVEGFCSEADWLRAYEEINEFEQQLVDGGAIVLKFWMSITRAEQLKRFRAREKIAHKQHKITAEDWRNRDKWRDYEQAVCDMIERTSTTDAPWCLVPANDKRHARVAVLERIAEALQQRL